MREWISFGRPGWPSLLLMAVLLACGGGGGQCQPVRECESDSDCPAGMWCDDYSFFTIDGQTGTTCTAGACNNEQDCPAGDVCTMREAGDSGIRVTRGVCGARPCTCTVDCPDGSRCGSDFYTGDAGFCYPESPPCQTDVDCDPKLECRRRENPACAVDGGVTSGTCQPRLCSTSGADACTGGQICGWFVCVDPVDK